MLRLAGPDSLYRQSWPIINCMGLADTFWHRLADLDGSWLMLLLQQGGFSEVHLAQDKLTGKTVALKVVFLNKGGLTKDQVGVGRVLGVPSRGIAGWLQQQAVWAAAAGVCGCG